MTRPSHLEEWPDIYASSATYGSDTGLSLDMRRMMHHAFKGPRRHVDESLPLGTVFVEPFGAQGASLLYVYDPASEPAARLWGLIHQCSHQRPVDVHRMWEGASAA